MSTKAKPKKRRCSYSVGILFAPLPEWLRHRGLTTEKFSCIAEVRVTSAYSGILSRSSARGVSGPDPASSATLASAVVCSSVRSRVGHSQASSQTARAGGLPQAWLSVQTHESKHRILKSGGILDDAQRARLTNPGTPRLKIVY